MEAESATAIDQTSPWKLPRWGASALFKLGCRSVWRPKVRQMSIKPAPGGRRGGVASTLFKLSC
eukprot:12429245-Karenia_brevis.AAC.1